MPIVSSRYWNMVHGFSREDVLKDEEGVQCMRILDSLVSAKSFVRAHAQAKA